MSNQFKNRIFGCVVVKSVNSNFNADFTHQPRTLPDGTVYATDKALKYSVRNYLKKVYPDDKIFYFKSFDEKLKPRTLDKTYTDYFGDFPKMKAVDTGEYLVFKLENGELGYLVSSKPKPKDLTKFFKDLDDDDELKSFSSVASKLNNKDVKTRKLEEAQKVLDTKKSLFEEDEDFVFFVDKAGDIKKVEGDFDQVVEVMKKIDELSTGGVDRIAITKKLLTCLDIRLFGGTYAGTTNLSFHGPLQITHGVNRYPENIIYSEQISSPFRNPKEKNIDSTQTTLGSQSKLKEGHYVFHFSVNPHNLNDLVGLSGGTPLQDTDISKVKEGLSRGVTLYDSAAKSGSENELMLWVQLKEGSMLVLPSFVELVSVDKETRTIDLSKVAELLNRDNVIAAIDKIEIYYDSTVTKVTGIPAGANVHVINQ
jgi:CRISPR/Cas system type I-B associated protein Csh2 (Cas7 group RAMP superfamily)